jgi:glycerol-3-phosphate dehydrogenase
MNLVTARPAGEVAVAAPTASGRMLTLVPWRGLALVGTSHSTRLASPRDMRVTSAEVGTFVSEVNEAFPHLQLTPPDVTLVHRGVLPAIRRRSGPDLLADTSIQDHAADGAPGAFTVVGVKYTTARAVADRTVRRLASRLGKRVGPSQTGDRALPGGALGGNRSRTMEAAAAGGIELQPAVVQHLVTRYRDRAPDIVRLAADHGLATPLGPSLPAIRAEVVHAIRAEMALHLTDIVLRRIGLGAAGHPGPEALAACAQAAAAELGWNEGRVAEEIAAVDAFYSIDP